jgi:hypothetical protein
MGLDPENQIIFELQMKTGKHGRTWGVESERGNPQ